MKVVVFGAAQLAELTCYVLTHDSEHEVVGFTVDAVYLKERNLRSLPVVPFEEVETSFPPGEVAMIAPIGWHRINGLRAEKHLAAKAKGYAFISYVSSRAIVWPDLAHGENCLIFDGTNVQPFATFGDGVIVRSGCNISHHVTIGHNCLLSPGVTVGGGVEIGERCFLGIGSVVGSQIRLAPRSLIAAGALVTEDTEENGVYQGVPAKKRRIPADWVKAH